MDATDTKNLSLRDQGHLWHTLTQHQTAAPALGIVKAKGALLWDEDGKEYIDGIASWYTCMYGHGNEHLVQAISEQMKTLDFVLFSGFTHAPAVNLAERLVGLLPQNQEKLFFNDNGSTAVEAAIKMALQYHHNNGEKRDTLIAFENGFHGDTFGAMSASGLSSYNGPFEDFLLKVIRIPTPTEENMEEVSAQLRSVIAHNACAAFVYEPLVQGAAGMKFHSAPGLNALLGLCKEADILCIADEIMTGFGKTGKHFASENMAHLPDIICLSKALTAGMFPLSITSCTQAVYNRFLSTEVAKGFFHAHTYSAHPMGCAAALAGLDLLESAPILERRAYLEKAHRAFVAKVQGHPKVTNARSMGVIMALDLNMSMARYGSLRDRLYRFFMERGIVLRPLGNTVYVLPPYVITNAQLEKIYDAIWELLHTL
ncbi:adenosylmethionine--8-amino-7-oxononanoate transaminase [Maribacter sp. 2307ULW6-5]|uniref:adenosylmethionine--8-amino-7-oxononanoate transaminase n=1 Tax=Maribacter sp. 2307ULW6-5 TaxID=3386275 RepID=UPI0039BC73D9